MSSQSAQKRKYKLTYFPLDGRGEAIRLAFTIGGLNWENDIIDFAAWPGRKPSTPYGTIPILTMENGKVLAQTNSILRFVGKAANLYPTCDDWDSAKIDEILDAVEDHIGPLFSPMFDRLLTDEQKKNRYETATKEGGSFHIWASNIEKAIASNAGNYAVGNNLTVADLKLATVTKVWERINGIPRNYISEFPHIKRTYEAVYSHPKVQEYYTKIIK